MKREYQFTIARRDRIYILSFVTILISWELIKYVFPETTFQEMRTQNTFIPDDKEAETTTEFNRKPIETFKTKRIPKNDNTRKETRVKTPRLINIMEADAEDLAGIGFKKKIANNILKYKAAGGQLNDSSDVLKIYGMDSSQWKIVSPYLLFPEKNEKREHTSKHLNRFLPKRIIDLNTASAIDLDSLPGIGAVLADRIINFRNSLGGFYEVEQIKSCYGIPPETIEKILPMLAIRAPLQPKNVNQIDWNNYYHPYLSKKFIPLIIAYKKHHGPFHSLKEFRQVFPPDTNWCNKLLPYITFSEISEEKKQ